MVDQTNNATTTQTKEIAVFDNLGAAKKAKELLQQAELSFQSLSIDGESNVYERVSAMGTTVGAEAGILLGAFFGGTLGVIFVTVFATLTQGHVVSSSINQLSVVAFTAAGSLVGVLLGRQVRASHLPEQRTKGNPNVARRFPLLVEGSPESISKAEEILGYSAS